ncbi:MAG: primosomal protein N' [Nitrospirota bacterium]
MSDLVADIAVGVAVQKTFHYSIPQHLRDYLKLGSRVLVPFGSRKLPGTIIGFPQQSTKAGLKSILEILEHPIPPDLLSLAIWMSDYYIHPIGLTIETLVPKALMKAKPKKKKIVRLLKDVQGLKGKKQATLMALVCQEKEIDLELLSGFSSVTIQSLVEYECIEIVEQEILDSATEAFVPSIAPALVPEQREAVQSITDKIAQNSFGVFLLHGITGSGKTEVYLHAIAALKGSGKGAIVLVPEIALTPQLVNRFKQRFHTRVAVLHSGQTDRERADEYRRIITGQVDVAIGARSAVFAPFEKIGLIVVDEEHETSYKQDDGLRYHARDIAIMRAKLQNAVAVLGSATPSLESYYNAKNGKYQYLHLPSRIDDRPLPSVALVDMKPLASTAPFSPALLEFIKKRLDEKEQILLLLNRRGFSSVLLCKDCGIAVLCPSCSVSLTYHKSVQKLKCHYCGYDVKPPDKCSCCAGTDMKLIGTGTQKIEEELLKFFPEARLRRMDSDAIKGKDAYDALLKKVDRREVDILLGTQMIAKGHDFPFVTLVGVVDADTGLNFPDFRAAEKTFQLMTQAAGRAGRGELGGEVIIQTMNPNHYAIRHSRTHDYEGFYNEEIKYRTELNYPPITRIIKIEIKSLNENNALQAAITAAQHIRSLMRGKDVALLGPAPAPISRVRSHYRFHLLLLSSKREKIRSLAIEGRNKVEEKYGRKCRVIIDVDPVNLM